jgi:transcriptional antiterminator RfaH
MHSYYEPAEQARGGGSHGAAAGDATQEAWFCLRTHPKHEHIAAAQLRSEMGIEVFLPRVRYERHTRLGKVWTTGALFCNYLFARFDFVRCLRRVRHGRAVRGVVHFGSRYPTIPESVIDELRSIFGPNEFRTITNSFSPGDNVRILGGPFHDLEAIVTRVMPDRQRVAVLLDFLGRQTALEMQDSYLTAPSGQPHYTAMTCA